MGERERGRERRERGEREKEGDRGREIVREREKDSERGRERGRGEREKEGREREKPWNIFKPETVCACGNLLHHSTTVVLFSVMLQMWSHGIWKEGRKCFI